MGGNSSEYEISLMSGREVIKNLNPNKYNIFPVNINRDGKNWQIGKSATLSYHSSTDKKVKSINKTINASILTDNKIDIVFIALHGPNGEDGRVQGFLELAGIPYTGSKVLSSAIAMDKVLSRQILEKTGLKVPKYLIYKKNDTLNIIWQKFKLPIIVKPPDQGSSVGITKVVNKKNLKSALRKAFKYSSMALVEEFIEGTEITSGILGNDKLVVLPLIEIVSKNDFFDYEAKYNELKCDEICPARINKKLSKKAQDVAKKAYQALGCKGFGRVDMIIKDGNIYILEVNTIPGLTAVSLLPKAAREAGISYSKLLDKIISYSAP